MKTYDKNELKDRVSIREVLQAYGAQIRGNRATAAWRGSSDYNFTISPDDKTCYDQRDKVSYDIFSFVAMQENLDNKTDFAALVERVGDRFAPHLAHDTQPAKTAATKTAVDTAAANSAKEEAVPPPPMPEDEDDGKTVTSSGIVDKNGRLDPTFGTGLSIGKAVHKSGIGELLGKGYEMVKRYHYRDKDGVEVLWVERWEQPSEMGGKKTFMQRLPYSDNYGGCGGVRCLYNWPELLAQPMDATVYIAEGEKCCDAITQLGRMAVTNPGGAGKWDEGYNDSFKGRRVVILADSDAPGVSHAKMIAGQLMDTAASLKLVIPYKDPHTGKGDIVDFFNIACIGKNKLAELDKLAAASQEWTRGPLGRPSQMELEAAKELNRTSLANFIEVDEEEEDDEEGGGKHKKRKKRIEKPLNDIMDELHRRSVGFPAVVGGNIIFDYDRDDKKIVPLINESALLAMIARVHKHSYNYDKHWTSPRVLFEAIKNYSVNFKRISNYPEYPPRQDTFYNPRFMELPRADKNHPYFNALMARLNPATPEDAVLLKSMFVAPMWSGMRGNMPLYIITSDDAQAAGKSTIINLINHLYLADDPSFVRNFSPCNFDSSGKMEQLKQTLISIVGNVNLKIVTLENLEGTLDSAGLAQAITQEAFLARLPYHSEDSIRINDLMWVVTTNCIQLSNDMASRALVVKIKEPKERLPGFKELAKQYIAEHRQEIFAEMQDIMQNGPVLAYNSKYRFPDFCEAVLSRICQTQAEYDAVMTKIGVNTAEMDDSDEVLGRIVEIIEKTFNDLHISPDAEMVFIPCSVLEFLKRKYSLNISEGIKAFIGRLRRVGNKKIYQYFNLERDQRRCGGSICKGLYWDKTMKQGQNSKYLRLNLENEIEVKDTNI